jgi:nucleotide-binding universal stress UspA family protein
MKVLLGIGGSEDSLRALDQVVDRAREAGDDLTVAVVENPDSDLSVERVEERARERLAGTGVDAGVRVLEGNPGPALVDLAEREGFDRIALGGGETSPLGKVQLGSIAEFVVLNSTATVMLVR